MTSEQSDEQSIVVPLNHLMAAIVVVRTRWPSLGRDWNGVIVAATIILSVVALDIQIVW